MLVVFNATSKRTGTKRASAEFLTNQFGLPEPVPWGPFLAVELGNEVTLDFYDDEGERAPQHYAFLVTEDEFDAVFGRIRAHGLDHWADPGRRRAGELNTHDGGRGVYFDDPSGHLLEIITRPYGDQR